MNLSIFKYFLSFIFKSKTRQKLILLAVVGVLISSFSLTVLQGIMGGLQNGLIKRSKNVAGIGYVDVSKLDLSEIETLATELKDNEIEFVKELELELMIQNGDYISPTIVHGMEFKEYTPQFLRHKDKTELVIGGDLGRDLRAVFRAHLKMTSPAHVDFVMQEIPRQAVISLSDYYSSELPEVDGLHSWVRASFLQNLIRKKTYNKLRVYKGDIGKVFSAVKKLHLDAKFISWEMENSTLVWALNLETKVMLFLFIGMSMLIGICITSGFLIFYNKVKIDLATFWILGLSRDRVLKLVYYFGQVITIACCFLGIMAGVGFLLLLDSNHFVLMPEQFVERNIPVNIEMSYLLVAFIVPYIVSTLFTHITFKTFSRENYSFLSLIRKLG